MSLIGEVPVQPTYSPRFTQDNLNALATLIDAAVKATGIPGAKLAMPIIAILEACEPDAMELTEEAGE